MRINRNKGFTFLEVMVALAIMSIALVTVIVAQSQSIALIEKGKEVSFLTEVARIKMAELELELRNRSLGEMKEKDEGKFEDEDLENYRWSYEIKKLEIPKGVANTLGQQSQSQGGIGMGAIADILGNSIKQLELTVYEGKEKSERQITLSMFLTDSSALPKLQAGAPKPSGG